MVGALALALACASGGAPRSAAPPRGADADDLLVVDCLLPGVVRQLGRNATYVRARRPIKTSAEDCRRRGGEHEIRGEEAYEESLRAWLPLAKQGDPEAQNYVGQLYEQSVPPDYDLAAVWYRRAAEQGDPRAQINLGQLYESGRGVPADPARARAWYRRASGLTDQGLAYVPAPADPAETRRLERALEARERALREAEQELRRLRAERTPPPRDPDPALRRELERLRADLARARRELAEAREKPATPDPALEREVARLQTALADAERERDATSQALPERDAEIRTLQAEVSRQREQLSRQREQLESLQRPADPADLPGPTLQIIEPPVPPRTRGVQVVASAPGPASLLIGRVQAPAGLHKLLVNQRATRVDDNGMFETGLGADVREVRVVVIDVVGRRAERRLTFDPGRQAAASRTAAPPSIDFGRYRAIVIGNDAYRTLPQLATARNDARAVAALLRERYGFETTELYDATRYDVLSALNRARTELTSEDNLLVYYAGHGELDEVNQRGHWLPVDAEPDSTANWISNVSVTDILNATNARHIIVVSDSCYSGSLTRSALARLESGLSAAEELAWQRAMASKRSRTALTSGGLAPVMDAGGGGHSVFARVLLEVLRVNDDVLIGQRLHQEIAARVTYEAERYRFEQLPQYAPIKFSGHEAGDFFFVPVDGRTAGVRP